MPTSHTDGDILADSFLASISGLVFVVNSLRLTAVRVEAERDDEKGVLAANISKEDLHRWSGTAELQIAESASNVRLQFETFTVPATASHTGTEIYVTIEEETANVVVDESRTRSVTIRRTPQTFNVVNDADNVVNDADNVTVDLF